MTMITKLLLLVTFGTSQCFGIDTVKEFDVNKYLGRWYQVFASKSVMATFERNAVCVLGEYSPRKEGGINVYNANRDKVITGPLKNITGYAVVKNPKEPGKLTVYLGGVPVPGDYWVVMIGPQKGSSSYEYSVVTDRFKFTLFVLARDVDTYFQKYDKQVQEFLKKNSFTWFWNKPVKTVQSKDCNYDDM